ncbi:hypothetical protein XBI1_840003 [Xenorhabdus bovienii str. Intermedium]|uniref:Uncharacterized protein n=1 Tax=Xenorhabdus bovienii str. Intermedium TaxID=1379677 RepID=A0A077QP47_XENBV|nr:hypothetical protein XBI1_840003 [Xenorhabdus bovienii str. Intermedium]
MRLATRTPPCDQRIDLNGVVGASLGDWVGLFSLNPLLRMALSIFDILFFQSSAIVLNKMLSSNFRKIYDLR